MTPREEEIQRNVEAGRLDGVNEFDAKAYQQVFSALKEAPNPMLSPSFADRVVKTVMERKGKSESSRDMWWFGIGIFLMSIALIVAFAFVGFKVNLGFLKIIGDFKWLIVLGGILMGLFHWLDKKLIRHEQTT